MEETSFSGVELAGRARVAPEVVARLVELGILRPGPGAAPFGLGDVRRVRLVDACAQAGLPLEGIGAAIAEGRLSLAFLDLLSLAGRPGTGTTCPSRMTRSTRWTGTCSAAPSWAGCWAWTTGC